ncbi:MAG: DUF3035 domain-containing protein [Pseudomonadota bacterium]
MKQSILAIGVMVCALGGCTSANPDLLTVRTEGPDEFSIVPTKPLQQPEDFASLPQPTPGGSNLVDPTPEADAFAALGGNAAVLTRAANDPALAAYTGRYGVTPNIRGELAATDLAFRKRNPGRILERAFDVTTYYKAYRRQALDQHAELERFRAAGVRTVAAPPTGAQ